MTNTEVKTIILRPLNRIDQSFSGLNSYSKTRIIVGAEIDSKTGLLKTGLSTEEQSKYEALLDLPKGSLGKRSSWWGSNATILLDRTKSTHFTIETPIDEIKYKLLLESSKICNSELERMKWRDAYFVIVDEEAMAEVESKAIDLEVEAYEILIKSTIKEKRGLLRLILASKNKPRNGVDTFTEAQIKTLLTKEMKENPAEFIRIANDKEIRYRVFLEELVEAGIVNRRGNYYTNGDEPIGNNTEEVIEYFKDPKHQSIKLALEKKLENWKKK